MSADRAAAVRAASQDPVPAGAVRLLRLGQAGVVLRGAQTTVVVDPWLADDPGRSVPTVPAAAIAHCDLVLLTHDHGDHADGDALAALAAAHPACRFAAPPVLEPVLEAAGVGPQRRQLLQPGEAVDAGEDGGRPAVLATAIAALHAQTPDEPYAHGRDGRVDFLGYAIAFAGAPTVYHAGDTLWWPGLEDVVAAHAPEIALLPVNGRDAMRERQGLVGNLDAAEAAALAAATGARVLVPIHHDGFAENPGDPAEAVRAAARLAPALAVLTLPAYVAATLAST